MGNCVACGIMGVTQAHVKDKSVCIKEGILDHKFLNIIDLCYNCHYLLFDERRMGIKRVDNKYFFIFLDEKNNIVIRESLVTLNVKDDYIKWKNLRCYSKLWPHLFS